MANHYLSHTVAQLDEAIGKVLSGELDVPLQEKTVVPSEEQQVVKPDNGYKGLSQVTVEAIPEKPYLCEVEYIQSSGTQYIDTGFKPNQDTRVVADMQMIDISVSAFYFGGRTSTSSNSFSFVWHKTNGFRCDYKAKQLTANGTGTDRVSIDFNKNIATVNDITFEHTYATFQSTGNLFIFAGGTAGTASSPSSARLYSFRVYDNGTLIRDYIPVLDKQCTPCLYDTVNGEFYYNSGTGQFTCPEKPYAARLSYIESSGTQYIDTGFNPNQNTKLDMVMEVTTTPTSDWPFGVRKSAGVDCYALMLTTATSLTSWLGSKSVTATISSILQKIRLNKDKTVTTITYANGTSQTITNDSSTFQSAYSLFLLNINLAGTPASANVSAKLYSCQLYDNGTLIRDYIPVLDNNLVPCLYDRVNNTFYYNSGTGTFQYAI